MRTVTLKINYANLKEGIENDYFHYLDLFYKSFLVSLVIYSNNIKPIFYNTIIENEKYNYFLREVLEAQQRGEDIVELINPKHNITVLSDMSVYTVDFFTGKHNEKKANIYNLTIDDHYNVVITNKQVGKNVY